MAVTAAVIYFFFKYQRKSPDEVGVPIHGDMRLETAWIVIPLVLSMFMFAWGAEVYVDYRHSPPDTLDIYVIGKQWMWKVQQPNGLKEINELHVPVGRDVRLIMASEDVIHDFSIPAFRVKMDVVPGHYNTMWFRPTGGGALPLVLFAILRHQSRVDGRLDYRHGAGGLCRVAVRVGWGRRDPWLAGEKLFTEKACITCHLSDGKGRAPSLNGVYGGKVLLADGSTVTADDSYLRESLLQPNAKIVAGFQPLMPTFQGQLTEEQIIALTAYIKSLQTLPPPATGAGIAPATGKK